MVAFRLPWGVLKGYESSVWIPHAPNIISDDIWYCLCLYGVCGCDWSRATEFTNYGVPTGALTTIGHLIIFLILLKIG